MQYNSRSESLSDTLHVHGFNQPSIQEQISPVTIKEKRNPTAVTKLSLKDKAGLVFVVCVLLMLQLLEKVKILK